MFCFAATAFAQISLTDKDLERLPSKTPAPGSSQGNGGAAPGAARAGPPGAAVSRPLSEALDVETIFTDLLNRSDFRGLIAGGPAAYHRAMAEDDYLEAEKLLLEALAKPGTPDGLAAGHSTVAVFYGRAKKVDLARKGLMAASALRPGDPLPHALEAWLCMESADFASADTALRKARALNPDYLFARVLQARLHSSRRKNAAALEEWRRVRLRAPGYPHIDGEIARLEMEIHVAGRSRIYATPHFSIEYERSIGDDPKALQTILADVERARIEVAKAFRHTPPGKTQLLVYTEETFRRFFGHDEVVGLFHPYDGVIRLRWSKASSPGEVRFRAVVFHEYAHALLHSLTGGRLTDRWLHEGLAMWAEQFCGFDVMRLIEKEDRRALASKLPPFSDLDMWRYDNYLRARIIVDEIIQVFGVDRWLGVFEAMGKGRLLDEAMEESLGRDYLNVETMIRRRLR